MAVEWFFRWQNDNVEATVVEEIVAYETAKAMERQKMIKFAKIVLDNISERDIELIKPIEDIYNETYGKN